jgi:hypothetical protein
LESSWGALSDGIISFSFQPFSEFSQPPRCSIGKYITEPLHCGHLLLKLRGVLITEELKWTDQKCLQREVVLYCKPWAWHTSHASVAKCFHKWTFFLSAKSSWLAMVIFTSVTLVRIKGTTVACWNHLKIIGGIPDGRYRNKMKLHEGDKIWQFGQSMPLKTLSDTFIHLKLWSCICLHYLTYCSGAILKLS